MDIERIGFDPTKDIELDARTLAALAHPLRLRMLGRLRVHGPATATQLARELGESSGATSYHLRQLQAHGLVEEDTERGTGRERWWRSAHRNSWTSMGEDEESRSAGGQFLRAVAQTYSERILRYADSIETAEQDYGKDWAGISTISDWKLDLTPEQAARLRREIFETVQRYVDAPAEPGQTKPMIAQVQLLPQRPPGQ